MSYGFDMGFAQANSLQEAMAIALEYTQSAWNRCLQHVSNPMVASR